MNKNNRYKFRVWDNKNKRFLLPYPTLDVKTYSLENSDRRIPSFMLGGDGDLVFTTITGGNVYPVQNVENYVIQQFTGLVDKNGNEIYEGDIVSVLDDNNVFEVKFGKVRRNIVGFDTTVDYPVEISCFYFDREGLPHFSITENFLGKHDLEDTKVIGNIFENGDLLL